LCKLSFFSVPGRRIEPSENTGHFHAQGVSASDPVTPGKRALRLNGLNEAVTSITVPNAARR
jgi:hypothetical protein